MPISLENALEQEEGWPSAYYNAVRFYFWEPELLSKVTLSGLKRAAATHDAADDLVRYFHTKLDGTPGLEKRTFEKIGRTEEPFNHQLELFLKLASKQFFDLFLNAFGETGFSARPSVLTRTVELVRPGGQPDILLLTPEEAFAIEVKPPHGRSFPGQLAKYALLMDCIRQACPQMKRLGLVYLANGGPEDNFPSRTPTLATYRQSEATWALGRRRHAFKGLCDQGMERVAGMIASLKIDFIGFDEFISLAGRTMNSSETERLLVGGLASEMRRRGYLLG